MASVKKSVMFSEDSLEFIQARTRPGNEIAWSESLNEGFKSQKWMIKESLPELSQPEWEIILNAYSGCLIEFHPPFRLASDIMDDRGAIELSQLDAETRELVVKLHKMPQIQQYAILDFVKKYWCGEWDNYQNFDSIKDKIKEL